MQFFPLYALAIYWILIHTYAVMILFFRVTKYFIMKIGDCWSLLCRGFHAIPCYKCVQMIVYLKLIN